MSKAVSEKDKQTNRKKKNKETSKASFGQIHLALVFSCPAKIQVSQSECNLLKACLLDINISQHSESEKKRKKT